MLVTTKKCAGVGFKISLKITTYVSKGTFETEIYSFVIYTFYMENLISCIITLECCIRC